MSFLRNMLGNEPRKLFKTVDADRQYRQIDVKKRANRLGQTPPRFQFLAVPKNNSSPDDIKDSNNRTYLGIDGVFELISGHSRLYNKTLLRSLILNIIRGYGTNNHPNVNIRYYNSVRYSINKTIRHKSLAECLIFLSDIHECDDDLTKQTKLRDTLIAFFDIPKIKNISPKSVFPDIVRNYQQGPLEKRIQTSVLSDLKKHFRNLSIQTSIYNALPESPGSIWQYLYTMFQSNDRDSKLYKSPFPNTFGRHDLSIPKIFYSKRAIEIENNKNHIPIDQSYEKIDIQIDEPYNSIPSEIAEALTNSLSSQDQSQNVSIDVSRSQKRKHLSTNIPQKRRRKSTRQSRKERSQHRPRNAVGFVRTPSAFGQLVESFLKNDEKFELGTLKVSVDRFHSIQDMDSIKKKREKIVQLDDRVAIGECKICDIGICQIDGI